MFLNVPLSGTTTLTILIIRVTVSDKGDVTLTLDCGEKGEDSDNIIAFDFCDETLNVTVKGSR